MSQRIVKVLIFTQASIPDPLIVRLRAVSPRLLIEHHTAQTIEAIDRSVWRDCEVLYTSWLMPTIDLVPNLKWVQGHFAGVDHFLDNPLIRSVILTTASGVHAPHMAEYILMMMLAFAHRLPNMLNYQQRVDWPKDRWSLFAPKELNDSTLGIVGYGSIGRETARLAKSFGMHVLASKRDVHIKHEQGWQLPKSGDSSAQHVDRLYPPDQLRSMLSECDFVAVTVPLTAETEKMIGAAELRSMKRGAILINVARGGVIDEAALIDALQNNLIGGAGLDVFEEEPLPLNSPLWKLPNVILSPHVSGFSSHYDERAMDLFAENLRRYLTGESLLNVVDMNKGY
ncbi:MAG TPA: D-2-hydroxyacid dehydrogenase [Anaerolineae bacterium]|nr:D-2-hydroxyacid dehydrogenase [Anaerolineae bacterium]